MHGSQTDYLSFYLENIKKMIHCEENKITGIKKNISQTIQQGKNDLKEMRTKKKELIAQKQAFKIPHNSICTDSTNMGYI